MKMTFLAEVSQTLNFFQLLLLVRLTTEGEGSTIKTKHINLYHTASDSHIVKISVK